MATRKMSCQEAFNYVKRKRPIIFPNFGFQKQLMDYEKILAERFKAYDKVNSPNNDERKQTIEVKDRDRSSVTPQIKHTKYNIYEENGNKAKIMNSPPKGQIKPTQFHYP